MKPKLWVMRYEGLAGTAVDYTYSVPLGSYLADYEPEFAAGRGAATWTTDPRRAMRFATAEEAAKLWRSVSRIRPTRPDGKPNRPLTAFTITIERLGERP